MDPTFKGLAFPFQRGANAFPNPATDDDLIRQALIQLITTQKGQRVMRPDFGTDAWKFVFEDNNLALAALIQTEVGQSIAKNESRVILIAIQVERDNDGNVIVTIQYVIPATAQTQTLSVSLSGSGGTTGG